MKAGRLQEIENEVTHDWRGNKVEVSPFTYQPAKEFNRNIWMHDISRSEHKFEVVISFGLVLLAGLLFIAGLVYLLK